MLRNKERNSLLKVNLLKVSSMFGNFGLAEHRFSCIKLCVPQSRGIGVESKNIWWANALSMLVWTSLIWPQSEEGERFDVPKRNWNSRALCLSSKKANNLLRNVCKTFAIWIVGWLYKSRQTRLISGDSLTRFLR